MALFLARRWTNPYDVGTLPNESVIKSERYVATNFTKGNYIYGGDSRAWEALALNSSTLPRWTNNGLTMIADHATIHDRWHIPSPLSWGGPRYASSTIVINTTNYIYGESRPNSTGYWVLLPGDGGACFRLALDGAARLLMGYDAANGFVSIYRTTDASWRLRERAITPLTFVISINADSSNKSLAVAAAINGRLINRNVWERSAGTDSYIAAGPVNTGILRLSNIGFTNYYGYKGVLHHLVCFNRACSWDETEFLAQNSHLLFKNQEKKLFFLPSETPAPTGTQAKVWNGTAWETHPIKVFMGGSWQQATIKKHNGSTWEQI